MASALPEARLPTFPAPHPPHPPFTKPRIPMQTVALPLSTLPLLPPVRSAMHQPKKPSVLILRQLPGELARLGPEYASRQRAHLALAPYPTLDSLVAKLTLSSHESESERLALIATLIDLHRESRHPVWTTTLLRVFRPMLNRIRAKLVGAPADELDAALVSSFLETLLVVDTNKDPSRIAKLVRWSTRRLLFRVLKGDADWEEIGFGVDCETEPDPATEGEPILIAVWLHEEQGDAESVELVRTLFERGALWTLVRRRYRDRSPKEQMHAYRRLQGKRHRLVQRFRRRLRHEMGPPRRAEASAPREPEWLVRPSLAASDAALNLGAMS